MLRHRSQQGSVLVEFAVVAMLVFTVLFGLIEMGMLLKDVTVLNEAVRQGARVAAIGGTTATVQATVINAAVTLNSANMAFSWRYNSTPTGATYPNIMGDAAGQNNAPSGRLIRIGVIYQRRWLTHFIFKGNKQMSASCIVRRE